MEKAQVRCLSKQTLLLQDWKTYSIISKNKLKKQVDYDERYRESGQVRADAGSHS